MGRRCEVVGTVVLSSFVTDYRFYGIADKRVTQTSNRPGAPAGSGCPGRGVLSFVRWGPAGIASALRACRAVATRLRVPLGAEKPGACRLEAGRRFPLECA